MKVLVTGANGFVGRALYQRLAATAGVEVVGSVRLQPAGRGLVSVGDLSSKTDWTKALTGTAVVVHAAARVHVMQDTATDPLSEFRRVNVEGTLTLARQAARAGVRRFVFVSSIKVNGEATERSVPFAANDVPNPADAYGISKMEAENGLRALAETTGMEVAIVRPTLVYGAGVKANFETMLRWLSRGVPLPLGAVHNRRSLVALDNLVDLIVTCIDHPAAANQTFLVSDDRALSTTELLRELGDVLGKPARLVPVPEPLIRWGAAMLRRPDIAQRLCGSLEVDITKTRELLGWVPPVSVEEGLRQAAQGYRQAQSG